ncbi:MAG: hypothetical protein KAS04_00485 [Candidatus Aenigmarchaeota archaeon]|nr:hypothetical protein [Candidatus Aenigmarchaeota archaeon]
MSKRKKLDFPYVCDIGFDMNTDLTGGVTKNNSADGIFLNFENFREGYKEIGQSFPHIFVLLDKGVKIGETVGNTLDIETVFENKEVNDAIDILPVYGGLPMGYECSGSGNAKDPLAPPGKCDKCKYFRE